MAEQLTSKQVADIQAIMANVETAYRQTNAARTSLSTLLAVGKATCKDVKLYNLQVKAVYAYQASVASIVRANGGSAPNVPAPIYVAWKGIAGDRMVDFDCPTSGLQGPGDPAKVFIDPAKVEWRQQATPSDVALIDHVTKQAIAAGSQAGLGVAPVAVVGIVIVGIIVIVGLVILLKIAEALMDIPGKRETTKQIAAQAEAHRVALDKRAACYADCTAKGTPAADCGRVCDRLFKLPEFKYPGGGLGLLGTVLGVALVGTAGVVGFKAYKAHRARGGGGSDRRALPPGIREEDVIDVEAA